METLQTKVTDHLKERRFRFNFNSERSFFEFGASGKNGNWKVFIAVDKERQLLQIISICPIHTSKHQQLTICELLNRMNDNILLGKFSMDFEDGKLLTKLPVFISTLNFQTGAFTHYCKPTSTVLMSTYRQ